MNILIAPDSFKGSLTAVQAADAIVQGVRDVMPEAEIVSVPLADGGEGTVEALVLATRGRMLRTQVTGPMGEPVEATPCWRRRTGWESLYGRRWMRAARD
jgi:glycerate kinase